MSQKPLFPAALNDRHFFSHTDPYLPIFNPYFRTFWSVGTGNADIVPALPENSACGREHSSADLVILSPAVLAHMMVFLLPEQGDLAVTLRHHY